MKLQFCSISKWILVCLIAFATDVAAPAESRCADCASEDQIERGFIKNERGVGGILSLADQREYVRAGVGRREKPERAEHESLSFNLGSNGESSAKFLLAENDKDERRARGRKRKSGGPNEFRGSANNFAEDDGDEKVERPKWRKRSKRAGTKGTQTNEKLISMAKQNSRIRAVNVQKKGNNKSKRVGTSLQQKSGKKNYWNRLQAAKTVPKRKNNQNGGQAAYPDYPVYGNRPPQAQDYLVPQYGNPSVGGNPNFNYPTVQRNDLTTMLFTFNNGRRPQSTPSWQPPAYGVQTMTPPPFYPGSLDQGGMNGDGGAGPPRRRYTNGPRRNNGTKVNRFRKRFQYVQLNSQDEILVAWPFSRPNNVVTVLMTAMPSVTPRNKNTVPKVKGKVKKPSTKKPPATKATKATKTRPAPTSPTTTTTTTEMVFTEETINGSTAGMSIDINRFEVPSEQPMTMGFNIDEEFTGVILTEENTGSRRGKTADDASKFELMQGVLQGLIVTSPPPAISDLEDTLKDIMNANKDVLAKETTRPTTTTMPTTTIPPTLAPADATGLSNSAAVPGNVTGAMESTLPASTTVQSTTPGGTRPMTEVTSTTEAGIF
ncbi:Hypothetical predicted protein [Cloeon dipterum]|uniref:Uncharacterized protein n=1 Tax=Cloeon dipterum TaxID=197152 RepID=A0A8S1C6X6_9INSE|nr:Hypothetical predicted protein [Cloeon dipterum]